VIRIEYPAKKRNMKLPKKAEHILLVPYGSSHQLCFIPISVNIGIYFLSLHYDRQIYGIINSSLVAENVSHGQNGETKLAARGLSGTFTQHYCKGTGKGTHFIC